MKNNENPKTSVLPPFYHQANQREYKKFLQKNDPESIKKYFKATFIDGVKKTSLQSDLKDFLLAEREVLEEWIRKGDKLKICSLISTFKELKNSYLDNIQKTILKNPFKNEYEKENFQSFLDEIFETIYPIDNNDPKFENELIGEN